LRNETSISIDAPPERVWSVMVDVERWPEWTSSVTSIKRLDDGEFRVGSRARVAQPKLPTVVWEVSSLEPGRGFQWQNASPVLRSVGGHRVEPEGAGSKVTLWIEQTGLMVPLLALFYKGLTRRYVQVEAEGLKRRCEG
jgi:uncharacterized membrane protein